MNKSKITPQLVIGIAVIALGILFTLDNMDLIRAREILRYWPAVFVAIGLVKFTQSDSTGGRIVGAGFITLGSLMVLDRLRWIDFSVWDLWPIFLILFGFSLVRGALRRRQVWYGVVGDKSHESDSYIKGMALMGGVVRTNDSQDFKGGELTAIMGGCEIDLRQASIKDGEATIEIFAFWGGVEMKVPEDWGIAVRAIPILGGIDDKTRPPKGGSKKKLVITGYCIMGGAEIRN